MKTKLSEKLLEKLSKNWWTRGEKKLHSEGVIFLSQYNTTEDSKWRKISAQLMVRFLKNAYGWPRRSRVPVFQSVRRIGIDIYDVTDNIYIQNILLLFHYLWNLEPE